MEQMKDSPGLLELLPHPGFLVQENIIVRVNAPAAAMQISVGTPIGELLDACREDYEGFSGGCLYLTLSLSGVPVGACAIRTEAGDVFLLEDARENSVLESLALASRQLRLPLSNVMVSAQSLFAQLPESPEIRETAARLNRGLYQLLRLVGNMSDADSSLSRQETISVGGTFDEIFEKAGVLCQQAGFCLDYSGLKEDLFAMADRQQLERAVYNLLSNAMKFAPQGSTITARLTRRHRRLYLQIQDSGESPRPADLFHRYLRQSTLEDSRFGIGLGMVLIRSCAASHGGTVLIDTPASYHHIPDNKYRKEYPRYTRKMATKGKESYYTAPKTKYQPAKQPSLCKKAFSPDCIPQKGLSFTFHTFQKASGTPVPLPE